MKNICKYCGKEYEYEPKRGTYKFQYCSQDCKHAFAKKDAEPQIRICEHCGKEYWWTGELKNYEGDIFVDTKRFCSFECGKAYKYEKIKKTNLEKYGACGFASNEIKEKVKQTKLKRYGNEYYNNPQKIKQTNLEKYGVEVISQSKEISDSIKQKWKNKSLQEIKNITDKTKQTKLEKYGNETYVNSEKAKQTCLEKYGTESYFKTKEYKEKTEKTNLKKYGVKHCMQNTNIANKVSESLSNKTKEEWTEIINKRKCTNLEKYGVEYASQNDDIKQKVKQTNLKKFGNETAVQSDIIQAKIKQNNLKKFGTEYSIGSNEIQEKIRNTNKEKHGYEYPFQSKELRKIMEENRRKTNLERYGTENIIQVNKFKEKAKETCLEKYGVPYNCMTDNCLDAGHYTISKINLKFKKLLDEYNIQNELEFHLSTFSYDFICNNILVEINPTFTHNSTENLKRPEFMKPKDKYYHFNKTKTALENEYRCIHIWDWDDSDKVLNLLKNKENLYARKLKIREISLEDTTTFLEQYHLQNSCLGQSIRLGLYKGDELIQLMTFGIPRYNKNFEYELLRLCTKAEYKVIGGAEKLFNHFIKTYNPESIISYCDNSKFTGDVYKRLGMKLKEYGTPRKHWYNIETNRHITDNLLLQRGYSQLHSDKEHTKGESNELLMLEAGYLEIYDCGQSTYIWKR